MNKANKPHPTHDLEWRDSSHYDYVCRKCDTADTPSGWGKLIEPCIADETTREETENLRGFKMKNYSDETVSQCISMLLHLLDEAYGVGMHYRGQTPDWYVAAASVACDIEDANKLTANYIAEHHKLIERKS
jgi:hypothetical protein